MGNKIFFLVIGLCLIFSTSARAEHREIQESGQKVDGIVLYRSNYINPEESKGFWSHDINTYLLIDKQYGIGLDATFCPENDYLKANPFATWKVVDGLSVLGGLSLNSLGADYVQAGVWYFGTLGEKIKIFLDPRVYLETNDKAKSFVETFVEASYPLNDKLTLAVNILHDHWLGNGADWLLIGPVVYWKINPSITVFTRIARETNFEIEGKNGTDLRLGLKWSF